MIPEITGLVVAIAGLLGVVYKMWHDHTSLAIKVADALTDNAKTGAELRSAIDANTKSTDQFSKLLVKMVTTTKKKK